MCGKDNTIYIYDIEVNEIFNKNKNKTQVWLVCQRVCVVSLGGGGG
jgi:hypothetical protein